MTKAQLETLLSMRDTKIDRLLKAAKEDLDLLKSQAATLNATRLELVVSERQRKSLQESIDMKALRIRELERLLQEHKEWRAGANFVKGVIEAVYEQND